MSIIALITPSLTRLTDAVGLSKLFFTPVTLSGEAKEFVAQTEGVKETLNHVLANLDGELTAEKANEIIKQATKELKLKKGTVMRSIRVALTGELHGPDLLQTWLLLHQKGLDKPRLETVYQSLSNNH